MPNCPVCSASYDSAAISKPMNEIEREVILAALDAHQGNRTHAAKALGISVRTVRNRLRDYRDEELIANAEARSVE